MRRRKRKISDGVFDEHDSCQQAGGILGHGSVAARMPEQIAEVIVGMKESFAGDLEIFIAGADDQGDDGQDNNGHRPAHTQENIANNIEAAGQEKAHPHMSAEMDQLCVIRQRVGKDKSKVDNGRQEYGSGEFTHGILVHHHTLLRNPCQNFLTYSYFLLCCLKWRNS
jgi:hypothetical protein